MWSYNHVVTLSRVDYDLSVIDAAVVDKENWFFYRPLSLLCHTA